VETGGDGCRMARLVDGGVKEKVTEKKVETSMMKKCVVMGGEGEVVGWRRCGHDGFGKLVTRCRC